ncbi:HNH endonuclease [Rhodomicrobium lacus]|uniref:HNH endonuclease n=1 Tax=Rhodomicrobium lacus TaxID=2498452 RepID=UPI0026E3D258|nr:HNH endonuclease [Rhodomicrobium lacus]WKW52048.1 HNH endonuclease [Rhodomicrobium lacus]
MSKCIFCQRELVAGATDGSQPTKEHVIQFALGGSNGLVTNDVCKDCNSTLGETVDAEFINQEFMGFLRLTHNLPGYSGTVPDVVLSARSLDTNEPGKVSFRSDATVDVSHEPVIIRQNKSADYEEILIAAMPDRARQMAQGIIDKAKKQNKTVYTSKGKVANMAEDLLADAEVESSDHYKASMMVEMIPLLRGYAKIAFGYLHVTIGAGWTFSTDADALRAISRGEGTAADVKALVVQGAPEVRALFVGKEAKDSRTHVLGIILRQGQTLAMVSLFGGNFTFCFKVSIPEELILNAMFADRAAVEVDPVTRSASWVSYQTLLLRMSSFGR